ncbi:LiaF transmembrane domain-containing protein [Cellulomonas hominis]
MNRRYVVQAAFGLLIVVIGVGALLGELGVVDIDWGMVWGDWWPMLIIVVGLVGLLANPRGYLAPLIVIAVGVMLQLSTLDVVDVDFWGLFWPVLLIVVGLAIIIRIRVHGRTPDVPTLNSLAFWWGSKVSTVSQDFRGGSLSAIMGGVEADLRRSDIVTAADISIFTFWGGVEVRVPPTWRVEITGIPILGGWEDKTTPPPSPDAPLLRVNIVSVMGGAEIRH